MKALFLLVMLPGLVACKPETGKSAIGKDIIIVDVRTPEEWQHDGHAECSVNYPLDQFAGKIEELKAYKKVILVCRSGNRANQARLMLEQAGYKQAENSGAWQNIDCRDHAADNK